MKGEDDPADGHGMPRQCLPCAQGDGKLEVKRVFADHFGGNTPRFLIQVATWVTPFQTNSNALKQTMEIDLITKKLYTTAT
jgi:hypothetical protein